MWSRRWLTWVPSTTKGQVLGLRRPSCKYLTISPRGKWIDLHCKCVSPFLTTWSTEFPLGLIKVSGSLTERLGRLNRTAEQTEANYCNDNLALLIWVPLCSLTWWQESVPVRHIRVAEETERCGNAESDEAQRWPRRSWPCEVGLIDMHAALRGIFKQTASQEGDGSNQGRQRDAYVHMLNETGDARAKKWEKKRRSVLMT